MKSSKQHSSRECIFVDLSVFSRNEIPTNPPIISFSFTLWEQDRKKTNKKTRQPLINIAFQRYNFKCHFMYRFRNLSEWKTLMCTERPAFGVLYQSPNRRPKTLENVNITQPSRRRKPCSLRNPHEEMHQHRNRWNFLIRANGALVSRAVVSVVV